MAKDISNNNNDNNKTKITFSAFELAFIYSCFLVLRNAFQMEFHGHTVKMWLWEVWKFSSFLLLPLISSTSNHIHLRTSSSPLWLRPSALVQIFPGVGSHLEVLFSKACWASKANQEVYWISKVEIKLIISQLWIVATQDVKVNVNNIKASPAVFTTSCTISNTK